MFVSHWLASEYHQSLNPGCTKICLPVAIHRTLLGFQTVNFRFWRLSPDPFWIDL